MVTFTTDLEVLNYALTLEHFENALYKALIATNVLTGVDAQYLTTFGAHEAAHVTALTQTIQKLGGTPVAPLPAYNFAPAGPLTTRDQVVNAILGVEDVGASAYLGAAGFLQNKDLLEVAVNIMNVEGEHAAVWRFQQNQPVSPDTVAKGRTPDEVLAIVTPFLQAPAGGPVAPPSGGAPSSGVTTTPGQPPASSGPVGSGTGSGGTGSGGASSPTNSTSNQPSPTGPGFVRRLGDG